MSGVSRAGCQITRTRWPLRSAIRSLQTGSRRLRVSRHDVSERSGVSVSCSLDEGGQTVGVKCVCPCVSRERSRLCLDKRTRRREALLKGSCILNENWKLILHCRPSQNSHPSLNKQLPCSRFSCNRQRLFGLVVRRPPREQQTWFDSSFRRGHFSRLDHGSDLKIGTPVAVGIFSGRVMPVTERLVLQWLWAFFQVGSWQ